ncbi:MAG: MBL fold metallo-hydrolase [Lachnospiraceae bacterium]|nr:MBL fold metallo-hydrolase [Lachnospiraceae bacterium]
MAKIEILQMRVGELVENCYVCANKDTKECFIVDPGDNARLINLRMEQNGYKPVAILLTHGHWDHIGAAKELKKKHNIPIIASAAEDKVLSDPRVNLSAMFGMPTMIKADEFVNDGQVIEIAGLSVKVILTPGHTCGGACFYIEENGVLFSGDTLFSCSYGRTDFPTGSAAALFNSIKNKLLVLPEDTIVYAGHMEATSIGNERLNF